MGRRGFLPDTDPELLGWALAFSTRISAGWADLGLTEAEAISYSQTFAAYASALEACDPAVRSKTAVAVKNAARRALKTASSQTASLIKGTPSVTDAQKIELGLNVRAKATTIPAPGSPPALGVVSSTAWTVKVKLRDSETASRRGKPPGVAGASIFTFVGDQPPAELSDWTFHANTGRSPIDITFNASLPPGTKVWLTAFWFNPRKQSGPACTAVSTNLPGGSVSMAA
jgi:hypothetical protein